MINWLSNPKRFERFAGTAVPICGWLALVLIVTGFYFGLYASPEAQGFGQGVRIMYVHVPSAWVAMAGYSAIAVMSFISFIWRHPLADRVAYNCALPGTVFTALALITGSLWGSQSWMTWWVWDGRNTSTLVLLFIYLGYIAIWSSMDNKKLAARIAGILAMVGAINLPIIKFSVDWWDDVMHQKASILTTESSNFPLSMLLPLMLMFFGVSFFFAWVVLRAVLRDIAIKRKDSAAKINAPATATLTRMEP
ncbi:heme ABC transporter permease CcmC [Robiginitomaculum antarcticum]|uniref:heme ABC transporter permease CcmC n=1 Tax=Robiginitomaculum antarcticum TaxID=437507 RepID=UPI000379D480|nr:heme ABC transporter permease CcmC [Robiginitomaculum antarcticum]